MKKANKIALGALSTLAIVGLLVTQAATGGSKKETNEKIKLEAENTLSLLDEVNGESVSKIQVAAQKLNDKLAPGKPIYLVLNTPGGSIQDGLELISYLKGLGRPVNTITVFAASMGFQIVQAMDKRYIIDFGTLMAHKARGGFSGEFPGQLNSRLEWYTKRLNEMDKRTVARLGGKHTIESFRAKYENEYWVDGFNAVSTGFADSVATPTCGKSLSGTEDINVQFFGMDITLVVSKCPLITGVLDIKVNILTNKGWMSLAKFKADGGIYASAIAGTVGPNVLVSVSNAIDDAIIQNKINEVKAKVSFKSRIPVYRM